MSNLKLEDGFYWVDLIGVVEVKNNEPYMTGYEGACVLELIDFGPNPQPIPKPEWCL